ncbi:hypothetical protein [Jidongwangia harbinensis]|uniref:hypothetical protein n=1 Tax=Jidongwangia harbinensis TaxID=2878561 RepID=UPI001CD93879|nr:hypothetical protein [Jidongwangia harbinensis]MCA2217657.1 hypothetical protein [Jidongwangia harbinensis]
MTVLILDPPRQPWVWVERASWVAALCALLLTTASLRADRRQQMAESVEQSKIATSVEVLQQGVQTGSAPLLQAARDIHHVGTAHYGALTPNDHGFKTPFMIVTTMGIVACVAIVAVVSLDPAGRRVSADRPTLESSSTAPTKPYVITLKTGVDVDTTNGGPPAAVVFPQGIPRVLEPQPPGDCESWYSWGKEIGGVDYFHTYAAFTVSALSSAVRVHSARVKVKPLERKAAGEYPSCPVGQPPVTSYLDVDLDSAKVSYYYPAPPDLSSDEQTRMSESGEMTPGGLLRKPFALEVEPGKSDRILVEGFTEKCFCSWWLELDIEVDGTRFVERIDDKGEPFVTAPKSGDYVGLSWDMEQARWCGPSDNC